MKKFILIVVALVIIISIPTYSLFVNKQKQNDMIMHNKEFTTMIDSEYFTGTVVANLINKVVNWNEQNNIQKNDGLFVENDSDSIIIEVKFILDKNKNTNQIIRAEKIEENGTENFLNLYKEEIFTKSKVEYHSKTGFLKYILLEQKQFN